MNNILTPEKAKEILDELGYANLKEYQKANNLPETNKLDSATERHLLQIRYCNLPDQIVMDARLPLAKWGKNALTWGFTRSFSLRGFSRDDLIDVFKWVWQQWANNANLSFSYDPDPSSQTNIIISSGRIDSAGNTLAWSELPNQTVRQLNQKYDIDEPYIFSSNPPSGKIDLGATGCHEGGHALGISHAPNNIRDALLAPIYNPRIRTPQSWDIEQIKARYGAPIPAPLPPVDPTDPNTPPPTTPTPENPFIDGLDYRLKPGYICCAVPIGQIAPIYRPAPLLSLDQK